MQTCIGPSEEHVSMAGIPTEASIYGMVEKAMPGRLQNVYCSSAGGGKYMAVLQFKKLTASDEGRQRQAALLAFSAFSELKHVFLVDEDVDCFDMSDVLWAMNTRFQGDADIITIPGVRCHPLDPSNDPTCSSSIRDHGIACKTIFDCTVPYDQKHLVKCNSQDKGKAVMQACTAGCIGCKMCEKACKFEAVTVENNIAHIDYEKCKDCGACAVKCPKKVIS